MLWVELKRLYEPDPRDQLWALQKYMHDPLEWKLYDTCGVHHVSTRRGHEIFMLVEKDYPLTKGLTTVMLCTKLQVDQYSEMANELLMKIYKHQSDTQVITMKMEILLEPTSNKLMVDAPVMRTASAVTKPYQGDSSEFYLITGGTPDYCDSEDINEGLSKGKVPKEDINESPSKGKLAPLGSSARPRPEVSPELAKLFKYGPPPDLPYIIVLSSDSEDINEGPSKGKVPKEDINEGPSKGRVVLGLANLKTWDDIVQKIGKRPPGNSADKGKGKAKV
ncbi:hypothetical protein Tco_0951631 [Tanacetum coccineum]|uniref:Uncharacterized protein n=1 Tax=Tanacetum coccineum TaxID=301880 RepID=A0ABQ5DXH5_9ASTR